MFLRPIILWCIMFPATILLACLGLLCAPFARLRYRIITAWSILFIWLAKRLCSVDYRITGAEHLVSQPASIVACKHQSSWETFFMPVLLPEQCWVLKRELLWIPIFGWALALLNPIAINRGDRKGSAIKIAQAGRRRLKQGKWIVIFPEGTRVPPGKRQRYAKSAARLAIETGADLVPIAHNAGVFWKNKSLLKQKGTIDVIVGAPIKTQSTDDPKVLTEQVEQWIENTVAGLAQD